MARCGCDCKNQTIDADSEANEWPCCDVFPDGVPCRYAVIAECSVSVAASEPWPFLLEGEIDTGYWSIMWPIFEVKKGCFNGCDWHLRQYVYIDPERRYIGDLTDVVTDAMRPAFPPASITDGVITYHKADFRDNVYADHPFYEGCYAPHLTFLQPGEELESQWTLSITSVSDVTLTMSWTSLQVLSGRITVPVYTSMSDWDEWGRNTLELSAESSAEWPEFPRRICVVALDDPGITNPCTSHAEQCACCDPGTDTASITGNFSGCGRVSGEVTWTGTRYKSPTPLPGGVSYPASSPCGVFWGTIGSGGDNCENGGVTWSGSVGLMTYCNGTTWLGKAYCYDTDLAEWVEQGDLTISGIECRCGGVYFDVELPTLDCCCEGGDPIKTGCCPGSPIPRTITAEGVLSDCTECTGTASASATYVEGETYPTWDVDITVCSRTYSIRLVCEVVEGSPVWSATMIDTDPDCGLGLPYTGSFISADCDPLEIVFIWSISGCCGDIAEAPLLTVTWTE